MIEVTRTNDRITISGHANYAEPGKDIVCAGVSILAQTLVQSLEDLTLDKIQYDMSPGWVDIKHGNLSEQAHVLIDSFFIGIEMIVNEYPEHVCLTEH